jgi:hypothetical protein
MNVEHVVFARPLPNSNRARGTAAPGGGAGSTSRFRSACVPLYTRFNTYVRLFLEILDSPAWGVCLVP